MRLSLELLSMTEWLSELKKKKQTVGVFNNGRGTSEQGFLSFKSSWEAAKRKCKL